MQALMDAAGSAETGQALYVQGLTALQRGDSEEAAAMLARALQMRPAHAGIRRNLMRALLLGEEYAAAVAQADALLERAPDDVELLYTRGSALNGLGQPALACAAFARALALAPNHAASWLNMGNASVDLDDHISAETMYQTAIRLDAGLAEAHASLGYLLTAQGRLAEAIVACEAAIQVRPDFAQAHWNLAIALLLSGDLPRGFAEYEWRKRHLRYQTDFPALAGQIWDGGDLGGKTILVRAEQGFGDAIHFARYLSVIRAAGGNPVMLCSPALVRLIGTLPGVSAITSLDPLPAYDCWIDQASLPLAFGTTLATVPAADGYLRADPVQVSAWRARLPEGRRVGLVFAGNPRHTGDRWRSIPPEVVGALPQIPDLHFVSLHHGSPGGGLGLPDLTPLLTDYADTAALIQALDLVIAVDTSVAHLAGALGKPVWLLLPHAPDWRWLLGRTDSPWYQSMRLFRQPARNEWASVLTQVWSELAAF